MLRVRERLVTLTWRLCRGATPPTLLGAERRSLLVASRSGAATIGAPFDVVLEYHEVVIESPPKGLRRRRAVAVEAKGHQGVAVWHRREGAAPAPHRVHAHELVAGEAAGTHVHPFDEAHPSRANVARHGLDLDFSP